MYGGAGVGTRGQGPEQDVRGVGGQIRLTDAVLWSVTGWVVRREERAVVEWAILKGLSPEQQRAVLERCTRRRFRKGDTIFHEGDPGNSVHLLDRGVVAVRIITPLGDTATIDVLGPGAVFGEQALLRPDAVRSAGAVALEAVETLALRSADFDGLRATHPSTERFLVEILAARVHRLSHALAEALYLPADTRVLRRLVELCDVYASRALGPTITIPVTQDDLASMAGTTRPTANRVLRDAVSHDLVAIGRGRIDVIDAPGLKRRAR
jgi:CRP/FNR family transcriptional regulator, cyclic AMP receptor protein